jgi:hypothetical protein
LFRSDFIGQIFEKNVLHGCAFTNYVIIPSIGLGFLEADWRINSGSFKAVLYDRRCNKAIKQRSGK